VTSVFVTIQTEDVESELARMELALQPYALMGWLKEIIEPYIQRRATQRFADEGDDVSGKWAPLTDATINFRTTGEIDYGAEPINVRTGALRDYVTNSVGGYMSEDGDALMIYPGSPPSGSNATGSLEDKFLAAQQGLDDPRTPRRPVLGVNEKDLAFVLTELEIYVATAGRL
jgi:hypothetical protein